MLFSTRAVGKKTKPKLTCQKLGPRRTILLVRLTQLFAACLPFFAFARTMLTKATAATVFLTVFLGITGIASVGAMPEQRMLAAIKNNKVRSFKRPPHCILSTGPIL